MKGKVYLVGAGPGDYKLITLKGKEAIKVADVIVYDRLASPRLLDYRKKDCQLIYVGKESSNHTKTQDEINDIICQKALDGKIVTRLKGGDPYVFGRGGEEGQYLIKRGVEIEVVPGITSAIGGLAYAGIPITHRDYASSFHVITGHLKDERSELDWDVLAKLKGTLVFLMGMSELKKITTRLIEKGMANNTPVAVINWATTDKQKVSVGTLTDIYNITQREGLTSPSIIVIGDVVQLRGDLNFFENKPLYGKKIIVTRARSQRSKVAEKIFQLGGTPIELPVIKIKDLSDDPKIIEEIKKVKEYNYLVFTSQNGVRLFFDRLFSLGIDARSTAGAQIVAIGKATAKELEKYNLRADIVPKDYIAEGIYEELKDILKPEDRILLPRAKVTRDYLKEELGKLAHVKEIKIYETIMGEGIEKIKEVKTLLDNREVDYIIFSSSSTVKNLVKLLGSPGLLKGQKLVSIGPITSKTIVDFGLNVYREAEKYDIDGVLKVILDKEAQND